MAKRYTSTQTGFRYRGFTLVELLVVISIMAMLIALLIPTLQRVAGKSRQFGCQMNLRSVAFDFSMFADRNLRPKWGDDKSNLSGNQFWLETFQESEYEIDEFWSRGEPTFRGEVSDLGVMACPEVRGQITMRNETACSEYAIQPARNISFAFNVRLWRPERKLGGMWATPQVPLSDRILSTGREIPLLFDIDAQLAEEQMRLPFYSGPAVDPDAPYSSGSQWFPTTRHDGQMQVAFVGGSVKATMDAVSERNWAWDYQAEFNH